jgi:hypothetical protein
MDEKWMGTSFDKREMRVLNLQQVVRVRLSSPLSLALLTKCSQRNFGSFGIFGFAVTLLCTWENLAMYVRPGTSRKSRAKLDSLLQKHWRCATQRRHGRVFLELCHR